MKYIISQGYLMDIKQIKDCIKADNYEMSQHALERALERDIWKEDIEHAMVRLLKNMKKINHIHLA
jgi:hypothetical protein